VIVGKTINTALLSSKFEVEGYIILSKNYILLVWLMLAVLDFNPPNFYKKVDFLYAFITKLVDKEFINIKITIIHVFSDKIKNNLYKW
jgi:hypothetical protein